MADFREAMRNPPNTGFHCYRAIEAMMQAMKFEEDQKDSRAWELFRNNLKITPACLKAIKVHADPPRHGKMYVMTDAQRAYVFVKTQSIIIRFLEDLKRGRMHHCQNLNFHIWKNSDNWTLAKRLSYQ